MKQTIYINSDWSFHKEELKFATIEYMQIGKLPAGIRFVIQDGYKEGKFKKYASFSKKGNLIVIGAGNTIQEAKEETLRVINLNLRQVALYDHSATTQDFINKLKEYR